MNARAIPLEAIYERDVDLLLLEELSVSSEFASWLVGQTDLSGINFGSLDSVQHSVVDQGRESDLIVIFLDTTGDRYALLIENKIDAPAQPDQSSGYRSRAHVGIDAGRWKDARTCILAPEAYLGKDSEAKGYNIQVSYEAIAAWFDQRAKSDPRYSYRATVMRNAIEQARRVRVAEVDEGVTAFWHAYWKDVSFFYPELEFSDPGTRSTGSTWIQFFPKIRGKARTIEHKLTAGFVDLSLPKVPASRFDELRQRFLPTTAPRSMEVVLAGKSLVIRSAVPKIDPRQDYEAQRDKALLGMKAAYRAWLLADILDPTAE
jgi:hypothetical protein